MNSLLKQFKHVIIHAIPTMIFFSLAFNFILYNESLMFAHHNINAANYITATIGGIVVGKFLIIVNKMPFIDVFPKKPLIYNISWKFFLYGILSLLFRIVDFFVKQFYVLSSVHNAYYKLLTRLTSSVFWSIQLWVLFLFAIYIVAMEFVRVLGKDKVMKLLFG